MTSQPRRSHRMAIVLVATGLAIVSSLLFVPDSARAGVAGNGDGLMTVTTAPTSTVAGSAGNVLTFTFTAENGKDFGSGSIMTLVVPAGWTAPTATAGAAGYTTATASTGTCSPGPPAISGTGPWTIQVSQTCANKDAFTITYGAATSGTRITAPSTAGANTFTTSSRSGSGGSIAALTTSPTVTVVAGAANRVAFVQGPANAAAGVAMGVTARLQDQYGNPVATSGTTITLTPSQGVINAGATATTSAGVATFNAVINTAVLGITLTASAPGLTPSAASTAFDVTVTVAAGAAALTSGPTDGAGAGVRSVSYYYCTGYSGDCIASTPWTLIGSSTNATSSFAVTWTSLPVNGPYRVALVATDNVTNSSGPSLSIPVTVAN